MKKTILYLIIIFIVSCDNDKTNSSSKNIAENCEYFNNYIKDIFPEIDSISLQNENINTIMNIIKNKLHNKYTKINHNFTKKFLCENSNICFGKKDTIEYIPVGYIKNKNFNVLIYEKYKKRFPVMLNEIYAVSFDTVKCKVIDKIIIYKDNNLGIVNTGEIGCKIKGNKFYIKYKEILFCEPKNEKEKYLKLYQITDEIIQLNDSGKFILKKQKEQKIFFDESKRMWVSPLGTD